MYIFDLSLCNCLYITSLVIVICTHINKALPLVFSLYLPLFVLFYYHSICIYDIVSLIFSLNINGICTILNLIGRFSYMFLLTRSLSLSLLLLFSLSMVSLYLHIYVYRRLFLSPSLSLSLSQYQN